VSTVETDHHEPQVGHGALTPDEVIQRHVMPEAIAARAAALVTREVIGPCSFTSIGPYVIRVEDNSERAEQDMAAIRRLLADGMLGAVLDFYERLRVVASSTPDVAVAEGEHARALMAVTVALHAYGTTGERLVENLREGGARSALRFVMSGDERTQGTDDVAIDALCELRLAERKLRRTAADRVLAVLRAEGDRSAWYLAAAGLGLTHSEVVVVLDDLAKRGLAEKVDGAWRAVPAKGDAS
jgi:hypothetical protein